LPARGRIDPKRTIGASLVDPSPAPDAVCDRRPYRKGPETAIACGGGLGRGAVAV
jgi:hypothetical protein